MEEHFHGEYDEQVSTSDVDVDGVLKRITLPTLISSVNSEEPRTAASHKSITPIRFTKSGNEQDDSAAAMVTLLPLQNLGSATITRDYGTHLQAITAAGQRYRSLEELMT